MVLGKRKPRIAGGREMKEKLYTRAEIIDITAKIIFNLQDIGWPPSGKEYEFKDYGVCQNWDLRIRIGEILSDLERKEK